MTDLLAGTTATFTGSAGATISVIDNATGATLLSCAVNATDRNSCSNTGSAPTHPGDRLEVKVTASGYGVSDKQWLVSFRR